VDPIVWIVLAVVIVALVALGLLLAMRRRQRARRSDALRERFGPEYERAVRTSSDRGAAETRLESIAQRRDELEIHPLSTASRARYDEQWDTVQARFVDEPGQAVTDADSLVTAVMRERGYPLEDFDDRAALLATDHPDVVAHYRAAHSAFSTHLRSGRSDTEDLRKAFVSYRSLFAALTKDARDADLADQPHSVDRHPVDRHPDDRHPVDRHPVDRQPLEQQPVQQQPTQQKPVQQPTLPQPIQQQPVQQHRTTGSAG
jgi:hypothetical protein